LQYKVLNNASWIILSKIVQSIISLVIGMISARYLGPSNYGLISYAASIVAFVVPVMQLGLSKTLVLELIERPDKEGTVLGTALFMNFISSIACAGLVFLYLYAVDRDEPTTIIVGVLYSITLIFQASEILQYWFQAKLLSKYISIASLVAYIVVAVYKVVLLVLRKSVYWFAISNSIDYLLIAVALLIIYYRLNGQKLRISNTLWKDMLHRSKHYIVSTMMVTIFQQTDRIMLKLFLNEAETGYYSAAITCVGVTGFVFAAIIDSFRPDILEAKKKNIKEFEHKLTLLYSIVTVLAVFQSLLMTILAKPIVLILYGKDYINSILPMQIAVWYTTFSYYGSVRNIWILAKEKQKYLWVINLSGAMMNVLINALLIPFMGAVGAATASLITQIFTNVIMGYILSPIKENNTLMIQSLNPKPLVALCKQILYKNKK